MSYKAKVINKRGKGDGIEYLIQYEDGKKKWTPYFAITDHLDKVMIYEQKHQTKNETNKIKPLKQSKKINSFVADESQQEENSIEEGILPTKRKHESNKRQVLKNKRQGIHLKQPKAPIVKITFLYKEDQQLIFEVIRSNKDSSILNNIEIRQQNPVILLQFYQKHVLIN